MCLIWGTTFLAIRIGSETVPPLWAATIRLALAAFLNAVIALLTRATWPRGSALRGIAIFGFLNLGVNVALLYWGELKVPSGISAVFYATVPLTTGVFAWLLGVQPLQRTHMIAAAVGLVGVAVIFAGEIRWGAPVPALLAVLSAAIVASLAGVILKRVPPHSSFVVNAIGAAIGACVCLLASYVLGEPRALPRGAAAWAPILYLTMAGSMGAFVLYAWLVSQWRVTRVSVGALIIPVIAVLVGALVRGESPAPGTYIGAALVLLGVSVSLFGGRITPRRGS
ncbi:MAG TPA: EamA family transporter [Candidatus Binatia bacterium]|nr:EamA family transporter [Candidatus Binatia bacterium]